MSKQIKIGFDKVPAPVTKQYTQLVDIEGTKLFDAAGNPLVTEEEVSLGEFTSSSNGLSVHTNNTPDDGGSIPVVEQFPATSEVSSSLLGIPRAEEQLSLFSDVATYGLDEDQWSYYTHADGIFPREWYRKENPVYGRREQPSFNEGSTEQALYLKSYPSQYTFPRGTRESRLQSATKSMESYMNFIALGRYLYDKYVNIDSVFAHQYFLDPNMANVVTSGDVVVGYNFEITGTKGVFSGNSDWFDVIYGGTTLQESFDAIERWTFFFDQIKAGTAKFPEESGSQVQFDTTKEYRYIVQFATFDCVPGGSSRARRIAVLESNRAFRYQPGRASGFTFGARMGAEPTTTSNFLEWGCSNDTDEYMFQLRGSQFNIVRRSTIKMPEELLLRQGLSVDDQTNAPVYPPGLGNSTPLWETVIPRSKWNGDALLGTGKSGYILSFEDVTMYKIEYSWYGAIGAKFYGYIPVGNGEARWVLLHTFVIENGLGQPVLANPDFKFKYLAYIDDSRNLQAPIFLYKYGSSYYVDGGDEGTIRLSTTSTDTKLFQNRSPILGLHPKNFIQSSTGELTRNYKKSYPASVSVNTDTPCRIDIEEVVGSPNGVHFTFSPGIKQGVLHPKTRYLPMKFLNDNTISILQGDDVFQTTSVTDFISITGPSTTVTAETGTSLHAYNPGQGIPVFNGISIKLGTTEHRIVSIDTTSSPHTMEIFPEYTGPEISNQPLEYVYKLNTSDQDAHIIANGVYGVYTNAGYTGNGKSTNIVRRDPDARNYTLVSSSIRDSQRQDGSKILTTDEETFYAKLTNYNAIFASKTPVYSNKFKIHFLNPSSRDSVRAVDFADEAHEVSGKHFSEFLVTMSPDYPIEPGASDSDDEVMFEYATGEYKYFSKNDYPYVEYCHQSTNFGQRERAERYEWDPSYGDQMSVDPRLDRPENYVKGIDRGYQSCVQGEISISTYGVDSVALETDSNSEYFGLMKVTFSEGINGPSNSTIKFDDSGNPLSEVGVNFKATGKFFRSLVIRDSGQPAYFYTDVGTGTSGKLIANDIADEADSDGNQFLQTKNLILSDDWQAKSFNENGEELYTDNQFAFSQAIGFNDQPLYPVFALSENAQVNGIVVEEIYEDGTIKTHCPEFVKESSSYNPTAELVTSGGSTHQNSPNSFNSNERLASCNYDPSSSNPLRPGNTLYSFYVSPEEPVQIDLSSVFNVDRKGVSRGLLNNKGIFFTATSITPGQNPGSTSGNVELTVTVKEQ